MTLISAKFNMNSVADVYGMSEIGHGFILCSCEQNRVTISYALKCWNYWWKRQQSCEADESASAVFFFSFLGCVTLLSSRKATLKSNVEEEFPTAEEIASN